MSSGPGAVDEWRHCEPSAPAGQKWSCTQYPLPAVSGKRWISRSFFHTSSTAPASDAISVLSLAWTSRHAHVLSTAMKAARLMRAFPQYEPAQPEQVCIVIQ